MMSVWNWQQLLHRCEIATLPVSQKQQEALFVYWKADCKLEVIVIQLSSSFLWREVIFV